MPNILKKIFRRNTSNHSSSGKSTHPRPLTPSSTSPYIERQLPLPLPDTHETRSRDLETLANLLRQELESERRSSKISSKSSGASGGSRLRRLSSGRRYDGGVSVHDTETGRSSKTMQRLLEVLEEIRRENSESVITPFRGSGEFENGQERGRERGGGSSGGGRGLWSRAMGHLSHAFDLVEILLDSPMAKGDYRRPLMRIQNLLDAQRAELVDLRGYEEGRALPTLQTLGDIYEKIVNGLRELELESEDEALLKAETLVQVLLEGPDYLIDVTIIEAVVWQAEIIDPNFAAEIRQVLDKAVEEQTDLANFRRAAESIIGLVAALPRDVLDDKEGLEAYKAIENLIKQLQIRVTVPGLKEQSDSSQTSSRHSALSKRPGTMPSPLPGLNRQTSENPYTSKTPFSPQLSSAPSSSNESDLATSQIPGEALFKSYQPSELQASYGTGTGSGPTPSSSIPPQPSRNPSSALPPASPLSSASSEEGEVWEYRGQLLTRSALSLVLRQEQLAVADSSGQYAGDVSWDDIRNCWIPKWAEKLTPGDVAPGEIPDTNPANFKHKKRDAWGNKIGWRDGVMFYAEEPVFDLRE